LAKLTASEEASGERMNERNIVENEGSAARDHLANERTLLAWVRTALGLIGLGVLVEKLIVEKRAAAHAAGWALVAFGAAMLVYAIVRYWRITTLLRAGKFPIATWGPLVLGGAALILAVAAAIVLGS
jgi:putative membrane protein